MLQGIFNITLIDHRVLIKNMQKITVGAEAQPQEVATWQKPLVTAIQLVHQFREMQGSSNKIDFLIE